MLASILFPDFIFTATNLRRDSSKPFVVSLSNHERLNHPPFDKFRANG